jgi:hypothetical protein
MNPLLSSSAFMLLLAVLYFLKRERAVTASYATVSAAARRAPRRWHATARASGVLR